MQSILPIIQIILSILLIMGILLQVTSAGIGASLGGGDSSSGYRTRRGFEKFLFYFTIVIAILFAVAAIASFVLR